MKFTRFSQLSAALAILLFVAGCTSYYRIIDQPTRRIYYTTDYDRTDSGAVRFYDEKSRARVTLQSSEIVEISQDAFRSGIKE
jgi:hypothetical protein